MNLEKYIKVNVNEETMDNNAKLLSSASFEVEKTFENGNFHLADRKKLVEIIDYLEDLRNKQIKGTY